MVLKFWTTEHMEARHVQQGGWVQHIFWVEDDMHCASN